MVDRYTKAILTAIAVALVWLCLKEPPRAAEAKTSRPPAPARPSSKPYLEPGIQGVVILGVATSQGVDEFKKTGSLSYGTTDGGTLPVAGLVGVVGTVDVDQPVQVTGTVDVDGPVRVKGLVDVTGSSVNVMGPVQVEGRAYGTPVAVTVSRY